MAWTLRHLMQRLRTTGTSCAIEQRQRWRSFFAELRDPAVAAQVEHFLHHAAAHHLRVVRPLTLAWAMRFPSDRVVRAFVLAASVGLCRALWLTVCPTCQQVNAQSQTLGSLAWCFGCQRHFRRCRSLPPELIFTSSREGLQQGGVDPLAADPLQRLIPVAVLIPAGGVGLLRPNAVSDQLDLRLQAGAPRWRRRLAILVSNQADARVMLCPRSWPLGGVVVQRGGAIVVRNTASRGVMRAILVPQPDPSRINEDDLALVPEYDELFR